MSTTSRKNQVEHADEKNFEQLVLQSPVPVLVDFYADWCGPCRMLSPLLDEIARETADVRIVKVNVDQSPALAERYRVSSIPCLKAFQSGKITDEHLGLTDKRHLKSMLIPQ